MPDVPPLSLENIRALQHRSYVWQLYPNSRSTYPRRSSGLVFTAVSEVFIPILLEMSRVHFFYYFFFYSLKQEQMTGLYFWHFCEEIFITDAYTGVEALIYFEYLAHRRGLGAICAVRGRKTTVWGQRQKELNPQQEALAAQHSPALPLLADNAGHCPWAPAPVCVRPVKAPRGPGAPPRPSGPVFACAATRRRAVGR